MLFDIGQGSSINITIKPFQERILLSRMNFVNRIIYPNLALQIDLGEVLLSDPERRPCKQPRNRHSIHRNFGRGFSGSPDPDAGAGGEPRGRHEGGPSIHRNPSRTPSCTPDPDAGAGGAGSQLQVVPYLSGCSGLVYERRCRGQQPLTQVVTQEVSSLIRTSLSDQAILEKIKRSKVMVY